MVAKARAEALRQKQDHRPEGGRANGSETAEFTRSLPVGNEFRTVLDDGLYRPAPDDWLIAVSDVVGSRKAIAAGRYKAVNMAGVAMISALMNALDTQDLPYIFGGDGAAIICSPADRDVVADTMAKTVTWVKDDLGLVLRAALVPVVGGAGRGLRRPRPGDAASPKPSTIMLSAAAAFLAPRR